MPPVPARYATRILLVLLVGTFLYAILRPGNPGPVIGRTTPDFQLTDLEGRRIQLHFPHLDIKGGIPGGCTHGIL
jgi:hypothetical protein